MAISIGILFGIITMLTYGISNVFLKKLTSKVGTYHSILYRSIFSAAFLFVVALVFVRDIFVPSTIFLMLLGIGFIGFIAYVFYVKGVEIGKISIIAPISHSAIIITVLLSIFFFKESLKSLQILAMVIIIAGVILISFKYSELKKSRKSLVKGFGWTLATAVGWGVLFFLWRIPILTVGPFIVAFYIEFLIFAFILISALPFKKKIFIPNIGKTTWLFAGLIGLLLGIGSLFYSLGISLEYVSIIAPIMAAAPLVTVIVSAAFLKERLEFNQIIAVALIIIGLITITL